MPLNPQNAQAWYEKGVALSETQHCREALPCLEEAQRSGHPRAAAALEELKEFLQFFSGGDGSSLEQAVIVSPGGPPGTGMLGPSLEYAWINRFLPGARPSGQRLLHANGKPYDVLEVQMPSGETKEVYFEISSFFGI